MNIHVCKTIQKNFVPSGPSLTTVMFAGCPWVSCFDPNRSKSKTNSFEGAVPAIKKPIDKNDMEPTNDVLLVNPGTLKNSTTVIMCFVLTLEQMLCNCWRKQLRNYKKGYTEVLEALQGPSLAACTY